MPVIRSTFHVNIDNKLVLEGLGLMRLSDAVSKQAFKKLVRAEINEAKKAVKASAKREVKGRDPRKSATAIRGIVYKRTLGGKVDIFEPKGKVYTSNYEKPRKSRPKWARGGNRAPRSRRTIQVESYYGPSRAFILRFLNSGTKTRTAGTRGYKFRGANRGFVWGSGWFENSATVAMFKAADRLGNKIADQVIKEYNKK